MDNEPWSDVDNRKESLMNFDPLDNHFEVYTNTTQLST